MIERGRDPLQQATGGTRFIDFDMLEMLGSAYPPASPAASDPLDRLLDNCEFKLCPVLKAKLSIGCATDRGTFCK